MEPNDQAEIDRIHRFLTRPGPSFGLALVLYRDDLVAKERRAELIERTSGQLRVASVQAVGEDSRTDLVARLQEAASEADVVFFHGLDGLLLDLTGRSRQSPALAHLNQSRDLLPERVMARVVFWMSRRAYPVFRSEALDLSEVILTTAELDEIRPSPIPLDVPVAPRSYEALDPSQLEKAEALERMARESDDPRSSGDAALSASEAYRKSGRPDEALEMGEFALRTFAALGDAASEYQAHQARAHALEDTGRLEEALEASQAMVRIARNRTEPRRRERSGQSPGPGLASPDAFLFRLAMSLNHLGILQGALRQQKAALAATSEAVEILRELARARPDAFLPDLAKSLNNLGARQREWGQREAALLATVEAVEILRELAPVRPDTLLADLAASLSNLGRIQSELGQHGLALAATTEAVEIYRKLAQDRPDAFLPDLAVSLGTHGSVLRALGHREAAGEAFREGLEQVWPLYERTPSPLGGFVGALLKDCIETYGAESPPSWLAKLVARRAEIEGT